MIGKTGPLSSKTVSNGNQVNWTRWENETLKINWKWMSVGNMGKLWQTFSISAHWGLLFVSFLTFFYKWCITDGEIARGQRQKSFISKHFEHVSQTTPSMHSQTLFCIQCNFYRLLLLPFRFRCKMNSAVNYTVHQFSSGEYVKMFLFSRHRNTPQKHALIF